MNCLINRYKGQFLAILMLALGVSACQTIGKKVKYYATEITLKNGAVLKGSTSPIAGDNFSFKDAQTSSNSTIQSKDVQSIIKQTPDGPKEYAQFTIINNKKRGKVETVLAAYEVKGEVSLIAHETKEHVRKTKDVNNRMTFVEETELIKRLYLKKQTEPGAEVPAGNKKTQVEEFNELAVNYFADAPALMAKIGGPGYEVKDIKKIVAEYNQIKAKKN
ncbi:hypothetical protein [Emticicia sp. 21SJ11W-3]|uniref:hypothetical protein n=1 Tax=Emticicia sp. 21SJ11W-3 TaxID=2916755 RepID=UPI00209D97AC|nr:hypothetical protein [Emticicia sp. 21SJ11W-3]UTA67723.1 hypothetical protein MB380_19305 [Emticicia sp. 21SJ11W-3]